MVVWRSWNSTTDSHAEEVSLFVGGFARSVVENIHRRKENRWTAEIGDGDEAEAEG